MGVNVHAAVTAWLATGTVAELTTTGFAQIDLDDLFVESPPHAVRTGLLCAEVALILARHEVPGIDGLLTIPLPGSSALTQDSPTLDDMLAHVWEYGPGAPVPVVHLLEPHHWRVYEEVEEYRTHLPAGQSLQQGWAAYYRTWRRQPLTTSDSGYERAIYVRTIDGA